VRAPGIAEPAERILIVRPGALGDLILTLPAIQYIRAKHPAAHITLFSNISFFSVAVPSVDRLVSFDSREMLRMILGENLDNAAAEYSRAYVWLRDPQDSIVANLRRMDTPVVAAPSFQKTETIWQPEFLLQGIGGSGFAKPRIIFTPEEHAQDPALTRSSKPCVAIHPGAGSMSKRWPLASFIEVARELILQDVDVVWILGPADDLELPAGSSILHSPDLRKLALTLRGMRACLGNDSGVTHLAEAAGCRSLAFFGPTNPAVWASGEFIYTPGPAPSAQVKDVLDRLITFIHHKQE